MSTYRIHWANGSTTDVDADDIEIAESNGPAEFYRRSAIVYAANWMYVHHVERLDEPAVDDHQPAA